MGNGTQNPPPGADDGTFPDGFDDQDETTGQPGSAESDVHARPTVILPALTARPTVILPALTARPTQILAAVGGDPSQTPKAGEIMGKPDDSPTMVESAGVAVSVTMELDMAKEMTTEATNIAQGILDSVSAGNCAADEVKAQLLDQRLGTFGKSIKDIADDPAIPDDLKIGLCDILLRISEIFRLNALMDEGEARAQERQRSEFRGKMAELEAWLLDAEKGQVESANQYGELKEWAMKTGAELKTLPLNMADLAAFTLFNGRFGKLVKVRDNFLDILKDAITWRNAFMTPVKPEGQLEVLCTWSTGASKDLKALPLTEEERRDFMIIFEWLHPVAPPVEVTTPASPPPVPANAPPARPMTPPSSPVVAHAAGPVPPGMGTRTRTPAMVLAVTPPPGAKPPSIVTTPAPATTTPAAPPAAPPAAAEPALPNLQDLITEAKRLLGLDKAWWLAPASATIRGKLLSDLNRVQHSSGVSSTDQGTAAGWKKKLLDHKKKIELEQGPDKGTEPMPRGRTLFGPPPRDPMAEAAAAAPAPPLAGPPTEQTATVPAEPPSAPEPPVVTTTPAPTKHPTPPPVPPAPSISRLIEIILEKMAELVNMPVAQNTGAIDRLTAAISGQTLDHNRAMEGQRKAIETLTVNLTHLATRTAAVPVASTSTPSTATPPKPVAATRKGPPMAKTPLPDSVRLPLTNIKGTLDGFLALSADEIAQLSDERKLELGKSVVAFRSLLEVVESDLDDDDAKAYSATLNKALALAQKLRKPTRRLRHIINRAALGACVLAILGVVGVKGYSWITSPSESNSEEADDTPAAATVKKPNHKPAAAKPAATADKPHGQVTGHDQFGDSCNHQAVSSLGADWDCNDAEYNDDGTVDACKCVLGAAANGS